MIRGAALVALSALLLGAGSPPAEAPWLSGIYSDVQMSGVTGDFGGMEARFYQDDGGRQMVEFVWCEGWCNETFKVPVTRTADGFAFSYVQKYYDGSDQKQETVRLLARPIGKTIRISAWRDDQKVDDEGKPRILKAAKRPLGISVARAGEE